MARPPFLFLFFSSLFLLSATVTLSSEQGGGQERERQCRQFCTYLKGEDRQRCEEGCQRQSEPDREQGGGQERERQCRQFCTYLKGEDRQRCEEGCQRQSEPDREQGGGQERERQCRQFCTYLKGEDRQRCEEGCQRQSEPEREQGGGQERERQCRQFCTYLKGEDRQRCEEGCQRQSEPERELRGQEQERSEERRERCRQSCTYLKGKDRKECERRCDKDHGSEEEQSFIGRKNPYFFDEKSYTTRIGSEEGNVTVADRFTRRTNLLRGIENYRLALIEANPRTFLLPHHWDADALLVVLNGRAIIHLTCPRDKEVQNLRRGDILRVRAGTTVSIVNTRNDEKLYIAKLMLPVSTPGRYQAFFPFASEDPESFYEAFDMSILEAAFNSPKNTLEKLFGKMRKGAMVRASEEQIREMRRHASSSSGRRTWPFGKESSEPFNLFNKHPTHKNEHGELYEATSRDYQELKDLDVGVSLANIRRGSMEGLYFNSKATKVALVVDGSGYYEAASPFMSREWGEDEPEQEEGVTYRKVGARLHPGTMFVVPAGHPVAIVADQDQDLRLLCFEIHVEDNERVQLAGQNMVYDQLDKEEKELIFNMPETEIDRIFKAQSKSFFLPGPEQRQESDKDNILRPLQSILDVTGF